MRAVGHVFNSNVKQGSKLFAEQNIKIRQQRYQVSRAAYTGRRADKAGRGNLVNTSPRLVWLARYQI